MITKINAKPRHISSIASLNVLIKKRLKPNENEKITNNIAHADSNIDFVS